MSFKNLNVTFITQSSVHLQSMKTNKNISPNLLFINSSREKKF